MEPDMEQMEIVNTENEQNEPVNSGEEVRSWGDSFAEIAD